MAQNISWEFYPGGKYNENIPTIESVLGYALGERLSRHADIEKYIITLANSSRKVELHSYGESYEGRRLYYLVISSPRNLAKIEAIKSNLEKLADPRLIKDDGELEAIIQKTPAITWIAANVHGREHSTAEAAMLLAYQLAAGKDETTKQIIENSVVIIDPLQNPDGRDCTVNYFYTAFGIRPNPDQNAAEHEVPWLSGRGNHYLFNLNRDWFPLTQQETTAKVKAYLEWHPQVYADLHEMWHNSSYYFLPPDLPINANFSDIVHKWWDIYGKGNADAFDKMGWEYYVKEVFDAFYPGYGECWPTFHGATGMTYEQAGVRGISIKRDDDTTLTYREAIHHHFIASMATCQTTATHKEERLRDFYLFHQNAIEEGKTGPIKEFLIVPGEKALNAEKLADKLMQQGIEVKIAESDFTNQRARNYSNNRLEERNFPAGAYIVRLDQPTRQLIKALFEKEAELSEDYVNRELERRKNRLPSQMYDVTAWSLPLAFDVDVYWTEEFSEVKAADLSEKPRRKGTVSQKASIAYLLRYTSNNAVKSLIQLLQEGYRVHVANKPFKLNGENFDRGTLVIKLRENRQDLHDKLMQLAGEYGVDFVPTDTSWTEEGISLGSGNIVYLKKPKVVLLYNTPASTLSYGWIAYLFEQEYGLEFTAVTHSFLRSGDLNDYNVIILPSGSGGDYDRFISKDGVNRLKQWVSDGGTLIALKGASAFLAREEFGMTTSNLINDLRKVEKKNEKEKKKPEEKREKKDEKSETKEEPVPYEYRPFRVPGAIVKVKLDQNHFLTYGYGESLSVLVDSEYLFSPSKQGWNVATYCEEEELRVSGFIFQEMQKALPGHVYLIDEPTGRGHIILYADDPNFRAYWDGLGRLFFNSVLFAPSLRR
ncbi:MAG: M14 family zinc carboxypeptidase [Candidatus Poribacteria bacterium]